MGIGHFSRDLARRAACVLAVGASLAGASSAWAGVSSTDCQTLGAGVCAGASFSPQDNLAAAAYLGSPGSPEDDLAKALDDLTTAQNADAAAQARGRALAILEGDPHQLVTGDTFLQDKAYKGIPLLNTQAKVQDNLAAGATVDVKEVRYGDHALLDTSMLRFTAAAMDKPFTIRWHVTELGTSFGGELSPAGVPGTGSAQHALVEPLVLPHLAMGTTVANRFHPAGGDEQTRLATQVFEVPMPAPRSLTTILDPNLRPGHETFAQIAVGRAPVAPDPAVEGDKGDPGDPAPAMPSPSAISGLSAARQIHDALVALDPADISAANLVGETNRPLVGAMRSRDTLPKPDAADPSADVSVQFANAEAYVSKRQLRVAPDTSPDGSVTLSVTNLDGVAHDFSVRQVYHRSTVAAFGVLNWGAFDTSVLETVKIAAGDTQKVPVKPAADAFALWVGDPKGGDQAAMAIALDRGPRQQSLELGEGPVKPLHEALDREGRLWVTMANTDEVVRLSPSDGALSAATPEHFPLPGGIVANPQGGTPAGPALGPGDVAVDAHDTVWVTLTDGNAIARIDPSRARPGTTDGITIYNLEPCTAALCRRPPPPAAPAPLSRLPLQMRLYEDGGDNTVIFFTEQNADAIGVLRVSADGTKLDEQHLNCSCLQPLGIALDPSGDIWFSEGSSNRLGRMTLDQTRPYSADGHVIKHYVIPLPPDQPPEFVPGTPLCGGAGQPVCGPMVLPNPALTALPHSVAVDRKGRVWYTGEASERIGYLDPSQARPNTTDGFHDTAGPDNEFRRALAPADMAIDAAGTVYFADEYGDQIASATVAADGSIEAKTAFRPAARNSLTDSPLVDPDGNLWFMEGGANLITRVSHVAAGVPLPARSPLLIANTATGRLTASGLREMSSVDIRLFRGGGLVSTTAGVAVQGGGFAVTVPLRADDRVEIVPHGEHPPAPFSFRVANLSATITPSGAVIGTALNDGAPLADQVTIDAGASSATPSISAEDGTFSWGGGLNPATASGTVSWTAGNVSARFRTVTPFAGASAGAGAGGGGAAPAPAASAPVPGLGAVPAPGAGRPAACATGRWLTRTGKGKTARRSLPLLGLRAAEVQRCLGKPTKRTARGRTQRWTYRGSVELRLTGGRVTAFRLLGRRLRSKPERAAVGTSLASFRRALGALARDGARRYRGVVAVDAKRFADVRLVVGRSGKVSRVTVSLKPLRALDRTGRRLLRSAR